MKALITGITGFVGMHLAEHLFSQGDQILGFSKSSHWPDTASDALHSSVELFAWNLGASEPLSAETQSRLVAFAPDCVYHLAALSVPADCGKDEPSDEAWRTNVKGTEQVTELVARLPGPPILLFTSSSHVYAPVDPKSPRVDERSAIGPANGYGKTKLAAEEAIRRDAPRLGLPTIIARAFQHSGPGQSSPMMLPQWAEQLVRHTSRPIEIYTRDAHIDLTDVRDVVRAYRLIIEHGTSGEVYNVGSGVDHKSGDILEMLCRHAAGRREVIELHPGFKQDPIAIVDKLVDLTGWRPEIPLEQTVADTYEFWRQKAERNQKAESRTRIT